MEAFQWLISWQLFDFPTHILEVAEYVVENPVVALAALPAISPLAATGGLGALASLAAVPPAAAAPALAPVAAVPALLPVAAIGTDRRRAGRGLRDGAGARAHASQPPRPSGSASATAARGRGWAGVFPSVCGGASRYRIPHGDEYQR